MNAIKKVRKDCKCDCGHTKNNHFGQEGYCNKCACTWFFPSIKRQKRMKKLQTLVHNYIPPQEVIDAVINGVDSEENQIYKKNHKGDI